MMPQYFRRSFPPPVRSLFKDTVIDYFHTDTREYLGTEKVKSGGKVVLTRRDVELAIDSCACADCLRGKGY